MNKLLLLLFSILISLSASGEWTPVKSTNSETNSIDFNTIKKNNDFIYWWFMTEDHIANTSSKIYLQGDCGISRLKRLSLHFSSEEGEDERTFENAKWHYVTPDSIYGFLLDTSCKFVKANEKEKQKILEEIQSKEELQRLLEAEEADTIAKKELANELQLELIDLQILIQEKSQEISKLDRVIKSYKKDEDLLLILGLKRLIKEHEQKLLDLNNQIEEAKLLYENEKYKQLTEIKNEINELSLKREAAQEAFEEEQYNRMLIEEEQAELEQERLLLTITDQLNILKQAYIYNLSARIRSFWRYQGAEDDWTCDVYVIQDRDGSVQAVDVRNCKVDDSFQAQFFKDSIKRAVYKASPLPAAPDEAVFDKELVFKFSVN